MVRLDVHDGASRRSIDIDADCVRIGRDQACEIVLPGDPTVSRVHATLQRLGDDWLLEDGSSRNGTYVNGARVGSPVRVEPGDRVSIGNFVVVLGADDGHAIETVAAQDADRTRVRLETGLSAREVEVLRGVCVGRSNAEIAAELFISIKTVQTHLDRIRDKTGLRGRSELVRYGLDHGVA
jgi:pSer/pThr/pTyr-binding forkhead associated (FHA) protein